MRVALVNPAVTKAIRHNVESGVVQNYSDLTGNYQPLGVLYLAAVLRQFGYGDVHVIDAEAEALTPAQVVDRLRAIGPDLVGLSCMTFSYLFVLDVAKAIKARLEVPVVIGGYHVQFYPKEILSHSCFDVAVTGEGEFVFLELVQLLDKHGVGRWSDHFGGVSGIAYRGEETVHQTPTREPIDPVDQLPHPSRDLLVASHYVQSHLPNPCAAILTTRGCPFSCAFCSRTREDRIARYHSPEYVVGELTNLAESGCRAFFVYDDTFTLHKRRVLKLCEQIKERRLKLTWAVQTRVELLNDELVAAMASAGCETIGFGIESGDEGILGVLDKGNTVSDAKAAIKLCKKHGMRALCNVMVGVPEETPEAVENTKAFLAETEPDWFKANILVPYPGSPLYNNLMKSGEIDDLWGIMSLTGVAPKEIAISKHLSQDQLEKARADINLMPYMRRKTNLLHLWRAVREPTVAMRSLKWVVRNLTA